MATEPLRIGVVGVGFGALVQIPGFLSEGVEVVAVCSRREERARAAAEKFGIPHVFTDYNQMLESPDLDAVSIVTPLPLHKPFSIAALEAGKHVMCEKPFTMSQQGAKEMLDAAQSHSHLTAMVSHGFRWAPQRAFVKELLEEGYIGKFHFFQANLFTNPRRAAQPPALPPEADFGQRGGMLWNQGSHYIDAFRHWFGDIVNVTGKVTSHLPERTDPATGLIRHTETDDSFSFTMEFANGGWGTMTASTVAHAGQGAMIEIFGSEGSLVTPQALPGRNPLPDGLVHGGKVGDSERQVIPMPERHRPFDDERDQRLMAFRMMVREFTRGVREGTSPSPNFYDGYRCQQVLDAVVESSQTGQRVEIPLS
jgi:predicted dehydrogenase